MFSKKDLRVFLLSTVFILAAYVCMLADPADYGFGILTLWVAPPLLLMGLCLPLFGIHSTNYKEQLISSVKSNVLKHSIGLAVFVIALLTYTVTLEPTASLWDCSEFIACAYKLQIPHSPGGPLFLLLGRIASMLVLNNVTKVAWAINMLSALFSALTTYIVFQLIYYFGSRITIGSGKAKNIILVLSALCGSLCLTFSDTFWFSAVEAETYASASFFLALLVWLIVTGKDLSGDRRSRRLVLIFYITGLSYCVHPMCLLALPLLRYCWYVTQRKITVVNLLLSIGLGLAIVMAINQLVAVSLFDLMFSFDWIFVNTLRLPFYSGAFVFIISLISLFIFLLHRYKTRSSYVWATIFLLAGFLPYVMIFIRSNFNPPIDETNPENIPLIKAYMNRESYGSVPLLYGPYFDAEIKSVDAKHKMFYKAGSEYKVAGTTSVYHYDDKRQTILPRMYSNDENNISVYRQWTGLNANEKPNFVNNITYMFRFQLGEMYLRYLLFNFAGRESDVQYSSWLKPWDSISESVPNKARNQYWMIPLILGLGGAVYHFCKHRKDFIAVCIFFLITGVVLVIYLNSPPNEPRERDYIYVGSYMAYCIWIGMGIAAAGSYIQRYKKLYYLLPLISLSVPTWMAYQNFDDHDRSDRTFQIDNARNLLQSCAPNSILFTGGDNDTFPLWYLQEVETFRTDVRVMVLSYMNTDWYINQLRRTYYNSAAFRLSLDEMDYLQYGANDVLYVQERIKEGIDAGEYLHLLHKEHSGLRRYSTSGEPYSVLPSRLIKISTADSLSNSRRDINLNVIGNYLPKGALAVLDLIISNHWERPIYFNFTSQHQLELNISPYLVQEGLVYRLTAFENKSDDIRINTKQMYRNLIVNADYKNLLQPDIYFNYEDYEARMIEPLRSNFNALAIALLNEGDNVKALEVLSHAMKLLYPSHLNPSLSNLQAAEILLHLDKKTWAYTLASAAFDLSFLLAKDNLSNHKAVDNLSAYTLQKSVEILDSMGYNGYHSKLNDLVQN